MIYCQHEKIDGGDCMKKSWKPVILVLCLCFCVFGLTVAEARVDCGTMLDRQLGYIFGWPTCMPLGDGCVVCWEEIIVTPTS